jgi:phenylalanyl-tRNA synthetase beta subunit
MDGFTKDAIATLSANIEEVKKIIESDESTLLNAGRASHLYDILKISLQKLQSRETDEKTKALLIDNLNKVYLIIPSLR